MYVFLVDLLHCKTPQTNNNLETLVLLKKRLFSFVSKNFETFYNVIKNNVKPLS